MRRPAESVADADGELMRQDVGFQLAAALQVGVGPA